MALQLGVQNWVDGDSTVLWHPVTGRHVRLATSTWNHVQRYPDDPRVAPVIQRLDRHYLLARSPRPPWPDLIPCRSRLVLFLPDEASLWLPVPGFRGAGGYGYRAFQLSPVGFAVWQAINDSRTIADVAQRAGTDLITVQALCALLTGPELQALQLRDTPPRPSDLGLERLLDTPRPPNARPPHLTGAAGETTLTWYHLHEITDGASHFDDRETTVAHGLGKPHPALAGQRYGAALRAGLHARGVLPKAGLVVEIGCGTGELAEAWLDSEPSEARYLRVDLSPELLRTQRQRVPQTAGVLADGLRLPLRDGTVDLIVNNEVIADLEAVPVDPDDPSPSPSAVRALDALRQAGVQPFPGRTWVNVGAFDFVAEIARVLKPGGAAWLSEFGVREGPPQEAAQLDHPEVAIQVEHLAAVARSHGLVVSVEPLADVLGLDLQTHQVSRASWSAVRALARSRDVSLKARSWTTQDLERTLPFKITGLRSVSFADEGPAPLITRFWSWTLRKPKVAAHSTPTVSS
ncbi:MAG: class I SAM-dependent methyltransferase [Myxococcota bacterium]